MTDTTTAIEVRDLTMPSGRPASVGARVREFEINDAEVYWLANKAMAALRAFKETGKREEIERACRLASAIRALVTEAA